MLILQSSRKKSCWNEQRCAKQISISEFQCLSWTRLCEVNMNEPFSGSLYWRGMRFRDFHNEKLKFHTFQIIRSFDSFFTVPDSLHIILFFSHVTSNQNKSDNRKNSGETMNYVHFHSEYRQHFSSTHSPRCGDDSSEKSAVGRIITLAMKVKHERMRNAASNRWIYSAISQLVIRFSLPATCHFLSGKLSFVISLICDNSWNFYEWYHHDDIHLTHKRELRKIFLVKSSNEPPVSS